jgi:methanogenic corrinoid protein MtbC1
MPRSSKPEDLINHDWGSELSERALNAVRAMDAKALDDAFAEAVVDLGTQGLLTQVAAPLAQQVGQLWLEGAMNSAHEHFLSAALRTFLGRHTQQFSVPPSAPVVLVTTPAGQIHELGAVIVSAAAANLGWKVIYLGTNLPAADIAGLAKRKKARAVALSIVYPTDDPELPKELHQLREYLPGDVEIIVGGRGASSYATALVEIRARIANKLDDLFPALEAARKSGKSS